jgi:hypothetical protein
MLDTHFVQEEHCPLSGTPAKRLAESLAGPSEKIFVFREVFLFKKTKQGE